MRIIINGAGIAGPTLAYWLRKTGHEVLLVEEAPPAAEPIAPRRHSWLLPSALGAGALFVVSQIVNAIEGHAFSSAFERRDVAAAERALDRLRYVANDAYDLRLELGLLARERGDYAAAIRSFERSAALHPNPGAWFEMARVYALRGDFASAADNFESAYAIAPFPPSYTAEFVDALARARRRERASEVLAQEWRKYPNSPELASARQALGEAQTDLAR